MKKIDLKSTTFIIPIKIEHEDRYRNALCTLGFLNRYFDTNIFIFEVTNGGKSKLDFLEKIGNAKIKHWISEDDGVFHRTKYLNIMLDSVETPVVVNYDIDVILRPETYIESQERIISGASDVVYPYAFSLTGQMQVNPSFDYNKFITTDFNIDEVLSSNSLNPFPAECGHCVFFNTSTYKEFGGENEYFISYGPEDKERMMRFQRLGKKVDWLENSVVYHFEHFRTSDSNVLNPFFMKNMELWNSLKDQSMENIDNYYKTAEYRSKYKTIKNKNLEQDGIQSN